jgi:pre-rRNA-processing protein TSR1
VKNRECLVPKNKNIILKVSLKGNQNLANFIENIPVLFNIFEYELRSTILNYEFTSQENPIPKEIMVDNGFMIYNTKCIVTRNLNSNVFKRESNIHSGIVSFIGPLTLNTNNAFIISDGIEEFKAVRLFNGYSKNRVFFDCVRLKGKPVKVCKSYAVIKGMFYNKEQVEYFRNIKLETNKDVQGFIKKPLGTKGAFKAYFAQQVKYGEEVRISLYKSIFL